ncbi:MAG: serine/threonine-protein kinase [Planctomycetota bacterium]|nr:serine/threonine-protein kinase [Planctomycetota bacterium]
MSADPQDPQLSPTGHYDEAAIHRARDLLAAIPESIGPYRILERIGGGGMGEVYRAEQRSPLRREVALKFIKLGMDTRLVIARFEAERQALALMDHPHIAKVFDAGADDTGRPYFVMEYVKGRPITEYADQNHLTISERLRLFEQVCEAVQHAHHKGVIHRDIKPGNVLVSTHDGKPFAKVIDFGVAKAIAQRLTDKTLFTQHEQLVGTPHYMSPEQAEGSIDIDTRTDVYSLGVLLYELLTGSTPFTLPELRAVAFERIKRLIVEVDPPQPSTRLSLNQPTLTTLAGLRRVEPMRLGTLVQGELDWIVMKALEKDRGRRYETPTSLADDVQAHLAGEPVQAAPPSTGYRLRKFVRKHRRAVFAGGMIAGALLLGVVGTSFGLFRANLALDREKEATAQAEQATVQAEKEKDAAEWEAYVANIGLAQSAMASENWPEARARLDACPVGKRGWEWEFLRKQAGAVAVEIRCEAGGKIDFSPDGERFVASSPYSMAKQWDFNGHSIGSPMRHEGKVYSATYSADGKRILTCSEDKSARSWDLTGRPICEPMVHNGEVRQAVFSPDQRLVLTTCADDTARLWGLILTRGYRDRVGNSKPKARLGNLNGHTIGEEMDSENGNFAFWGGTLVNQSGTFVLTQPLNNLLRLWDINGSPVGQPMRHDRRAIAPKSL